ncbi:MAG TPA: NAD(P)/FAD-dependent oxidoreductase [Opitutaceae bacterium]|nr:NAD(P)/FAD-dependent oxidoreductase [Opitutaceae bacterium]
MHDVVIVGAGPAGLSAALVLGRCRRSVLVVDAGEPRNAASQGLHGFLTREGVKPLELRRLGRAELARYPYVHLRDGRVTRVRRDDGGFEVALADGPVFRSAFLLLATGRIDALPEKAGFRDYYGRGVHHCPFCDAWEYRDGEIVVYGRDIGAVELARTLRTWTDRVTLCSDGPPAWPDSPDPAAEGLRVVAAGVDRLAGDAHRVREVRFVDRPPLACDAVFFCGPCPQRSALPEALDCVFNDDRSVRCDRSAAVGVPGLFVAGNVRGGLHLAIMAAAEGADAALAINAALLERARGGTRSAAR